MHNVQFMHTMSIIIIIPTSRPFLHQRFQHCWFGCRRRRPRNSTVVIFLVHFYLLVPFRPSSSTFTTTKCIPRASAVQPGETAADWGPWKTFHLTTVVCVAVRLHGRYSLTGQLGRSGYEWKPDLFDRSNNTNNFRIADVQYVRPTLPLLVFSVSF